VRAFHRGHRWKHKSLPVRRPVLEQHLIQLLQIDDLRRLAAQGENAYGALRAAAYSQACAIGRDIAKPTVLTHIEIKSNELSALTFRGVKGCDNQLFAILGRFNNHAQIGWRSGAENVARDMCLGWKNGLRRSPFMGSRMIFAGSDGPLDCGSTILMTNLPSGLTLMSRKFAAPLKTQVHHAFLWKKGKMIDLGVAPGQPCSTAIDINSRGQIIIDTGVCGVGGGPGMLWENGNLYDLNSLIPPTPALQWAT
jgi:hypothetical protein